MTRVIPIDRYRTIGILASQDAGRTTTTERILAIAGAAEGVVRDERAITVTSAATSIDWQGCRLNIVELPGIGRKADEAAERAVDAVVAVVDAERGVTPELEAALAQAAARGLARLVFVNKLDRVGADLDGFAAAIPGGALLQLPVGAGSGLGGIVDLVGMAGRFWNDRALDAPAETGPVPAALQGPAEAARARLVALAGASAEPRALAAGLRKAVGAGALVPVLCGSAFRNRGVRLLLDAIAAYLPAPSDIERQTVSAEGVASALLASDEAAFAGLAFRTVNDPARGRLVFVRVCSGVAAAGQTLVDGATLRPERVGAILRIRADHIETVDEARTGDVVAFAGLDHTTSGDALCDPAAPVILGGYRPRTAA